MAPDGSTAQPTTARPGRSRHIEPARRILAVDDDRMALMLLEQELRDLGYEVLTAVDGESALRELAEGAEGIDVVVLDKVMPGLDGLSVVRRLKQDPELRHTPIVMVTGDDSPDEIREGVEVGVFHYLTKPIDTSLLKSVMHSALRDASHRRSLRAELQQQGKGFELIDTCRFRFRTPDEAWDLATFMANCFPDPGRVLPGLSELLLNAIEHGNLEIGYERKVELVRDGNWRDEIDRRLDLPEYKDRVAEAVFTHRNDGVCAVISDQGGGFDWRQYLRIDPARASDATGRGIAQASTVSFDKLVYNDKGNQVVGYVHNVSDIEW